MGMCFKLAAAAGLFFVSAWVAMLFWGSVFPHAPATYSMAIQATLGLWLVAVPLCWATSVVTDSFKE